MRAIPLILTLLSLELTVSCAKSSLSVLEVQFVVIPRTRVPLALQGISNKSNINALRVKLSEKSAGLIKRKQLLLSGWLGQCGSKQKKYFPVFIDGHQDVYTYIENSRTQSLIMYLPDDHLIYNKSLCMKFEGRGYMGVEATSAYIRVNIINPAKNRITRQ